MRRASPVVLTATALMTVVALVTSLSVAPAAAVDDPAPSPSATAPTTPAAPTIPAAPTAPTVPTAPTNPPRPLELPARTTLPLRFDDHGPKVALAQDRLRWLGYELSKNSTRKQLFGITMRRAVKAFQAKQWLPVTGRIDRKTWRRLATLAEPVGVLPRRCTEVRQALCIDKTARILRYVERGEVRMTADARFGAPGMETGEGLFAVRSKSYNHVSSLYDSWMPRAMFFNGDEAVHYSPDFASVGYSRGSHGCIGLRSLDDASWLFDRVPVGTRVYVYWS